MTDHITIEQFEAALPKGKVSNLPLWHYDGPVCGERQYSLPVVCASSPDIHRFTIIIRSSLPASDPHSITVPPTSIRVWMTDAIDISTVHAFSVGRMVSHITRVPGWPARLTAALRTLFTIGVLATHRCRCPNANCHLGPLKLRVTIGTRRPFLMHEKPCGHFEYLTLDGGHNGSLYKKPVIKCYRGKKLHRYIVNWQRYSLAAAATARTS